MPNRNKRTKRAKNKPTYKLPIIHPPITKLTPWGKIKKYSKQLYTILVVIGTFIGWYFLKDSFHKDFASEHTKFQEEKFIKGILIPDKIIYADKSIDIAFGSVTFTQDIEELSKGFELYDKLKCLWEHKPVKFWLSLVNNRISVTATFKDIQKGEIVGILENNHWSLVKANLFNYWDTDTFLEVLDNAGNVIFSLQFIEPRTIKVRGYFMGDNNNVAVISEAYYPCNAINSPDDKAFVMKKIEGIERLHKY